MNHVKYPFVPMPYTGTQNYVNPKHIPTVGPGQVVVNNFTRPVTNVMSLPMQPWTSTRQFNNFHPRLSGGKNIVGKTTNFSKSTDIVVNTDYKASNVPPLNVGLKKAKMIDSQCQTDFPKEIADLHLKDLPNTLYMQHKNAKKEDAKKRYASSSSSKDNDREEEINITESSVHRNNVMSSGTHPLSQSTKAPLKDTLSYSMVAQKSPAPKPQNREDNYANVSSAAEDKPDQNQGSGITKKKRKRNRKKKKHIAGDTNEENNGNGPAVDEVNIHLEDEFEFPDLSGKKRTSSNNHLVHKSNTNLTSNSVQQNLTDPGNTDTQQYTNSEKENLSETGEEKIEFSLQSQTVKQPETKSARKRRRRQDQANKAANDEMAEITIEQQMLKELGLKTQLEQTTSKEVNIPTTTKTKSGKNNRKSNQPIALDFAAMIDALEQRRDDAITTKNAPRKPVIRRKAKPEVEPPRRPHNPLDSTCPSVKRGKEREFPKPKKPSPLKKVILKEREEKKRLRLLDEDPSVAPGGSQVCVGVVNTESDLSQDGEEKTRGSVSADLSPISQTSPFSMSPLSPSASPLHSGFNSPVAKDASNPALLKIHSRRYREYCTQILDKDIDNCCLQFLQNLVRYQDKQYHKDPKKAKTKRRIVLGLREVTKHLKLMKIKCVIISPNLEKIQSKGGLDDALNNILNMCTEQEVPYVFALGRRALGRACAKLVPVSVVGVFNYEGSEKQFWRLIELTQKATDSYKEMVSVVEKEIQENPNNRVGPTNAPSLFAHMGHSRTPSGCSAISFTSSILSEPISENYPYSEPETDSKGYEVSKSGRGGLKTMKSSVINDKSAAIYELDAGNEADTEDFAETTELSSKPNYANSLNEDGNEEDPEDDPDDIEELPHIDSIHYGSYDLSVEILSQHSSRTIENSEAMSTHSSKTLRDGSPTMLLEKYSERHNVVGSLSTPHKIIDKDRIQSWVEATQSCTDDARIEGSADEAVTQIVDGEADPCDNSEKEDACVS